MIGMAPTSSDDTAPKHVTDYRLSTCLSTLNSHVNEQIAKEVVPTVDTTEPRWLEARGAVRAELLE